MRKQTICRIRSDFQHPNSRETSSTATLTVRLIGAPCGGMRLPPDLRGRNFFAGPPQQYHKNRQPPQRVREQHTQSPTNFEGDAIPGHTRINRDDNATLNTYAQTRVGVLSITNPPSHLQRESRSKTPLSDTPHFIPTDDSFDSPHRLRNIHMTLPSATSPAIVPFQQNKLASSCASTKPMPSTPHPNSCSRLSLPQPNQHPYNLR